MDIAEITDETAAGRKPSASPLRCPAAHSPCRAEGRGQDQAEALKDAHEAAVPPMIRVTCNSTGDIAYAPDPEAAVRAAVQLNEDAGTTAGYRSFSFHNDVTDERIRVVNGDELYAAARSLGLV